MFRVHRGRNLAYPCVASYHELRNCSRDRNASDAGAAMSIRFLFAVLLGIAFLGFVVPTHGDDETSALINQQLDKQIKLTLDDLLPQAVDKITEQTGVPVKADPSVWE